MALPISTQASIDEVKSRIRARFFEVLSAQEASILSEENILRLVTTSLDEQRKKVLWKLLGGDTRWGGLEFKEGDGGALDKFVTPKIQAAVEAWFEKNAEKLTPKLALTQKIERELQEHYNSTFLHKLRYKLSDMAEKAAYAHAEEIRQQLSDEFKGSE